MNNTVIRINIGIYYAAVRDGLNFDLLQNGHKIHANKMTGNYILLHLLQLVPAVLYPALYPTTPERRSENIKYFISSSGNQTYNLSHLQSYACVCPCAAAPM